MATPRTDALTSGANKRELLDFSTAYRNLCIELETELEEARRALKISEEVSNRHADLYEAKLKAIQAELAEAKAQLSGHFEREEELERKIENLDAALIAKSEG
jgi:hypothetical protein